MKKAIIAIFILLSINLVYGKSEFLFSNVKVKKGIFGGFGLSGIKINKEQGLLRSFGGGMVINNNFYFGGRGYISRKHSTNENKFRYGGLVLGYIYSNPSYYHPYVSILYGGGMLQKRNNLFMNNLKIWFNAATIELGVQIKLMERIRIIPFAGYTSISFIDNNYTYGDNDFGGLNYGVRFSVSNLKANFI